MPNINVDVEGTKQENEKARVAISKWFVTICQSMKTARDKGEKYLEETERLMTENETIEAQNKELTKEADEIDKELAKYEQEQKELVEKARHLAKETESLEAEKLKLENEAKEIEKEEKSRKDAEMKRDVEIKIEKEKRDGLVEQINQLMYHTLQQIVSEVPAQLRGDVKAFLLVMLKEGNILETLETLTKGGEVPAEMLKKTREALTWKEGTDYTVPATPQLPNDDTFRPPPRDDRGTGYRPRESGSRYGDRGDRGDRGDSRREDHRQYRDDRRDNWRDSGRDSGRDRRDWHSGRDRRERDYRRDDRGGYSRGPPRRY